MSSAKDKPKAPNFLSDHASPTDFFGSHQRVADAIASVIRDSRSTRIIGILGPWGSGKSTIIRLLEKMFEASAGQTKQHYFFAYDAWLHQSDPPRRSFLESLVAFLVSKKLTTASDWKDDLDRLSRRIEENDVTTTPTLTLPGKLVALSFLLTATGWKVADRKETFDLSGFHITAFAAGLFLIFAPLWAGIIAWIYLKLSKSDSNETVFSIFVNKATERIKTKTIRTPDPTAIEFQAVFRKLLKSVGSSNRSFIFVIDNLDRIQEAEAIAIWSTIRSFFIDELKPSDESAADNAAPMVLLPLDPEAVQRMYGKSAEDAPELAQSFMDKTFDLAFHVNPPVQSGWQDYLAQRLRETLSAAMTDVDILQITKLYEMWVFEKNLGVTPRSINKLANEIAMLHLQWGDTIPLCTLAYYSIHRQEANFDQLLKDTEQYVERFDSKWAENAAAVHYGVPPDQVLQVLLLPKISRALQDCDSDAFTSLSKAIGFEPILLQALENQFRDTPFNREYVVSAAGMMAAASFPVTVRLSEIEKLLRNRFPFGSPWQHLNSLCADGIRSLIASCPAHQVEQFKTTIGDSLQSVAVTGFAFDDRNASGWRQCYEAVASTAPNLNVKVPGDAAFFLKIIDQFAASSDTIKRLKPSVDKGPIVGQVTSEAAAFGNSPETRLEKLCAIGLKLDWSPLVEAAATLVENPSTREEQSISSVLEVLGRLRVLSPSKTLNEKLKALSEGGLLDVFYAMHTQGKLEAEARALALIILTNPSFQLASAVGNAEAGRQSLLSLTASIHDRPQIYDLLDGTISRYGTFRDFINAAGANAAIGPLLKHIFKKRVEEGNIGPLHVDDIFKRLPTYLSFLDLEIQPSFLDNLASYSTFWDTMKASEINASNCQILTSFIVNDSANAGQSREIVLDAARALDSAAWRSLLANGAEPLPTVLLAIRKPIEPKFGEPLFESLEEAFQRALSGGGVVTLTLQNWFSLANSLDENRYRLLLKGIRDRLLSGNPNPGMLNVLLAGNTQLIQNGDFGSRSDDSTRHVILPLLDQLEGASDWLIKNGDELTKWIGQSDGSTQGYLNERVVALVQSKPESAMPIATALGVKALPSKQTGDDDSTGKA
jgi:hypothetical protein